MRTTGGRSREFITAGPVLIRAAGSPARPATMRRARSFRIAVGVARRAENPGPAPKLLRKGRDQPSAAPVRRDLASLQDTFRVLQRSDSYSVGADEGQRRNWDLR